MDKIGPKRTEWTEVDQMGQNAMLKWLNRSLAMIKVTFNLLEMLVLFKFINISL